MREVLYFFKDGFERKLFLGGCVVVVFGAFAGLDFLVVL